MEIPIDCLKHTETIFKQCTMLICYIHWQQIRLNWHCISLWGNWSHQEGVYRRLLLQRKIGFGFKWQWWANSLFSPIGFENFRLGRWRWRWWFTCINWSPSWVWWTPLWWPTESTGVETRCVGWCIAYVWAVRTGAYLFLFFFLKLISCWH